uniref:Uncharacterized protein n=1 Tax=Chromera velia CCMP2878 TaxID=1169474 RepID=A0A0G4FD07_9ALVE|eukprot:Cvel_16400.t1-p1 / transcript=Cvel_16400.t1 / gene=Cvel_16400 / organism=Chromera_velia_CCMP2878 / gene_product=hypothetical protein / transcript_product=hypothetical protein / location=Cvel_scaffold1262:32211-34615(-) / protein_length=167 / sequence_SO=supercontig / SO=protein_coding / is_pseudo=false
MTGWHLGAVRATYDLSAVNWIMVDHVEKSDELGITEKSKHFKRIAGECGWEEVTESVFVKKEAGSVKAVMAVHVDDLRDLEPLRKRLEMDEPEILEYGGEMGYTGMEVKRTEEGFALSQKAYLESIPVQKEDLPRKSLSPELIESSAEEETDESLVSVMQKVMGMLG